MRIYSLLLILISLIAFNHQAKAQQQGNCPESEPLSGTVQAQVLETSKGCSIMLSPSSSQTEANRHYSFGERGIIQIFNHFSGNQNGSRSFFVFPHTQVPTLTVVNEQEMDVVTSSGDLIQFDTSTNPPHIIDNPNAAFRLIESPVISTTNNGGVEIQQTALSPTLILDAGFQMGGAAFTHPTRTSTFHDNSGNHCTLINSKLFKFSNYDADLIYNDADLFRFLKTACPTLKLPALN